MSYQESVIDYYSSNKDSLEYFTDDLTEYLIEDSIEELIKEEKEKKIKQPLNKLSSNIIIPREIEFLIGSFVGNINMALISKSFNLAYKETKNKAIIKIQKFFKLVMKKTRCVCCNHIRHIKYITRDNEPFCEKYACLELCNMCNDWCGAYLCYYCKRM